MDEKVLKDSDIDEEAFIASFVKDEKSSRPPHSVDTKTAVGEGGSQDEPEPDAIQEDAGSPTVPMQNAHKTATDGHQREEREEPKRKRTKVNTDYAGRFLKDKGMTARSGKLAYVSVDMHKKIQKIIHIIGEDEISLSSYIHNVLEHHFELFQSEIGELYSKKLQEYQLDE